MKILESASKLVLIALTIAIITALFLGKVESEQFMTVAVMVYTYYFAKREQLDEKNDG